MRWPNGAEVKKVLASQPRTVALERYVQFDYVLVTRELVSEFIAWDLAVSANDIPNPRLTHRGPWTPGWTPL